LTKIIIVILILGVFLTYPGYLDLRKSNREVAGLARKVRRLEESNANLRVEIQALRKDPFSIEKAARAKLGLIKPGEIIYKIVPSSELKKTLRGGAGW
jgi:cell division protein FtsB